VHGRFPYDNTSFEGMLTPLLCASPVLAGAVGYPTLSSSMVPSLHAGSAAGAASGAAQATVDAAAGTAQYAMDTANAAAEKAQKV